MTQSLLCWKHLKSFLRRHWVIFHYIACNHWETFEIIFHLSTLSQCDYANRWKWYSHCLTLLSQWKYFYHTCYNLNDSIFIMLKTSQKFPEKALSHFSLHSLQSLRNFWDHFPPINFESMWLYIQMKWYSYCLIMLSQW